MAFDDLEKSDLSLVGSTVRTAFLHIVFPTFLVLFLLFVVPRFEAAFLRAGLSLPEATRQVINLSLSLRLALPEVWFLLAALYAADIAIYYTLRRAVGSLAAALWSGSVIILQIGICALAVVACVLPVYALAGG